MSFLNSRAVRITIILSLIFSPILLAYLDGAGDKSGLSLFVNMLIAILIGIPFIAISGLIFSYFTRNKPNANKLSALGYLFAAIPVWIYYGVLLFNHYYIHAV